MIKAKKVVSVWAEVIYDLWDYRVWPDGQVYVWTVTDQDVNGYWRLMFGFEHGFEEIKAAGLEVLSDNIQTR